jgi:hypothetical protein
LFVKVQLPTSDFMNFDCGFCPNYRGLFYLNESPDYREAVILYSMPKDRNNLILIQFYNNYKNAALSYSKDLPNTPQFELTPRPPAGRIADINASPLLCPPSSAQLTGQTDADTETLPQTARPHTTTRANSTSARYDASILTAQSVSPPLCGSR